MKSEKAAPTTHPVGGGEPIANWGAPAPLAGGWSAELRSAPFAAPRREPWRYDTSEYTYATGPEGLKFYWGEPARIYRAGIFRGVDSTEESQYGA